MGNEVLAALITAGGTVIAVTAGYVIWSVKKLVGEVGQLKIGMAVLTETVKTFPADHDKLIGIEKDVEQNTRDITYGFQSVRKRIDELMDGH